MRTNILILAVAAISFLFIPSSVNAQTKVGNEKIYYLDVYEVEFMTAKSVSINYGVSTSFGSVIKLADENNEVINFDNVLGALNYLGSFGWELVSTYTSDTKNTRGVHYIMKLDQNIHPSNKVTVLIDDLIRSLTTEPIKK